jgi:hypothetical protein
MCETYVYTNPSRGHTPYFGLFFGNNTAGWLSGAITAGGHK